MENSTDQKLSKKDVVAITIGLFLFVAEGINYSLIAPFFPTEAEEKKNISHVMVSLISCCFDVSNFVFTPLLAAIATPEMSKFFFITGATFAAVANVCFGVLEFGPSGFWFGFMSLLCRLLMGLGAGLVWSTGIPLVTSFAPRYTGRLTALIESGMGVGLVVGAPLGSVMFGIGGYNTPFAFSGAFELFFIIVAIFLFPNIKVNDAERSSRAGTADTSQSSQCGDLVTLADDPIMLIIDNSKPHSQALTDVELLIRPTEMEKSETQSKRIFKTFLSYKGVWFVSQFSVLTYITSGIINVALAPFLVNNFGVSEKTCGFYWISFALVYTTWAQVVGYLSDKGYAPRLFICGSISHTLTFLLLSLPQYLPLVRTKAFVVVCLCLSGFSSATTFAPGYLTLEKTAYLSGYKGFQENLKLTVGIWSNFLMCVGKILGSVLFGGIIYDFLGLYKMALCVGLTMAVSATICNCYLLSAKNFRKPSMSSSSDISI